MHEPFSMDDERAARIAAKRNQRQRDKLPLFAKHLEEVTAAQVKAAADRHRESFLACCRRQQAEGDAFREKVRAVVSTEAFGELERRRGRLPGTSEYHADFWKGQWEALKR
jgi:hypothetical protein